MATWSHFIAEGDAVNAEKPSDQGYFGPSSSFQGSENTLSAGLPTKFDPSIDREVLRTLSSSPLQDMSRNPSVPSTECLPVERPLDSAFQAAESSQIPRRNLTEAFEEIYTKPSGDTETPVVKQANRKGSAANMISPTGVMELNAEEAEGSVDSGPRPVKLITPSKDDENRTLPQFDMHPALKRELSDQLVDRVSFYAVIHDTNKEATAMATNDNSGYNRNPEGQREEYDPLIVAVNGCPAKMLSSSISMVKVALIDEERWLLDAIDSRSGDETRTSNMCPPTFLQAMGEREYENPLASLSNGSRTQLWKPSRSWWEAKSGKNPWIEPKSHNKRWGYLWPLIHYHKFLARCIKKLKRNGVDVKMSVAPVSVFLREEVCAVSDHLAAVSLFDSDEWMNCLQHFIGWTGQTQESEEVFRGLVSRLSLRPLNEPGDVDSPLLRSQIDEQYLRAMASARAQASGTAPEQKRRLTRQNQQMADAVAKKGALNQNAMGHPPAYPRPSGSPSTTNTRNPTIVSGGSPAAQGANWPYPPQHGHWWGHGWSSHGPYAYGDDTSVHSALSGDSFPQPYEFDVNGYPGAVHNAHYYPPMMYPQHQFTPSQPQIPYDQAVQVPGAFGNGGFGPNQMMGWDRQGPASHVTPKASNTPGTPNSPSTAQGADGGTPPGPESGNQPTQQNTENQTPYKYDPSQVPMSPYWGHLDHATLAMMGIATPQAVSAPQTPSRRILASPVDDPEAQNPAQNHAPSMNAQPLLLRQQYYGYTYGSREGYGPPSPATQFMMSPQANFPYSYGYDYSPNRTPTKDNKVDTANTESETTIDAKSPPKVTPLTEKKTVPEQSGTSAVETL